MIDRAIIDKNARIGESVVITPDGKAPNVDSYELLYSRRRGRDPEECGDSGRNLDLRSAVTIDPQFQRRLLAASGFAELSLFQEAVQELEELPEVLERTANGAGGLVRSLPALAEMVGSRVRRLAVIGNGSRGTELADRSGLCDPTQPRLGFRQGNSAASRRKISGLRNHSIQPRLLRRATRPTGRSPSAS